MVIYNPAPFGTCLPMNQLKHNQKNPKLLLTWSISPEELHQGIELLLLLLLLLLLTRARLCRRWDGGEVERVADLAAAGAGRGDPDLGLLGGQLLLDGRAPRVLVGLGQLRETSHGHFEPWVKIWGQIQGCAKKCLLFYPPFLSLPTRLGHLIDKFCKNRVYILVASHLHKANLRNTCTNFSQPVNDDTELTAHWTRQQMHSL